MSEAPENSPDPDDTSTRPRDDRVPRRRSRRRHFLRRERSETAREARRLRIRRHGRRAYIRSVYSLPSLATLGNAICGFGAMYVAALDPGSDDHLTRWFYDYRFLAAGYLIFIAMLFDAVDGRLARFARHTTDFGGQLDSLADVISFGCAPAFVALQLFHSSNPDLPSMVGRLMWSIGALYMSCAAIRLARFNVSNEHGEQYHFSFLGLPSPGAGAAVAGLILMQQDMVVHAAAHHWEFAGKMANLCTWALPIVVLGCGLLMVSTIRFPHVVNRYLRGRRSIPRLLAMLTVLLLMVTLNRYTLGIGSIGYVVLGLAGSSFVRFRPRGAK